MVRSSGRIDDKHLRVLFSDAQVAEGALVSNSSTGFSSVGSPRSGFSIAVPASPASLPAARLLSSDGRRTTWARSSPALMWSAQSLRANPIPRCLLLVSGERSCSAPPAGRTQQAIASHRSGRGDRDRSCRPRAGPLASPPQPPSAGEEPRPYTSARHNACLLRRSDARRAAGLRRDAPPMIEGLRAETHARRRSISLFGSALRCLFRPRTVLRSLSTRLSTRRRNVRRPSVVSSISQRSRRIRRAVCAHRRQDSIAVSQIAFCAPSRSFSRGWIGGGDGGRLRRSDVPT